MEKEDNLIINKEVIKFREYPDDVFPDKLKRAVKRYCENDSIQMNLAFHTMLGCIGAALSNKFEVMYQNKYLERPNLWCIGLAESGSNKTGILKTFLKPFNDKIFNDLKIFNEAKNKIRNTYNSQIKTYEKLHKELQYVHLDDKSNDFTLTDTQKILMNTRKSDYDSVREFIRWMEDNGIKYLYNEKGLVRFEKMGDPPTYTLLNTGGTMEGKELIFKENDGRAVIFWQDEFQGFISNLGKYDSGRGGHIEELLRWFQDGGSTTSLVNKENSREYKSRTVTMLGCSQPSLFSKLFSTRDNIENGLLARLLLVSSVKNRNILDKKNPFDIEEYVDENHEEGMGVYNNFISFILGDYEQKVDRKRLVFDDSCKEVLVNWYNNKYKDYVNGRYGDIEEKPFDSIMEKMSIYCTRISIIMRCIRMYYSDFYKKTVVLDSDVPISKEDTENTTRLMDFYLENVIEYYGYVTRYVNIPIKNELEIEFFDSLPNSFDEKIAKELIRIIFKSNAKTKKSINDFVSRKFREFKHRKLIIQTTKEGVYRKKI